MGRTQAPAGLGLVVALGLIVAVAASLVRKTFTKTVSVTVVSDRTGLVMKTPRTFRSEGSPDCALPSPHSYGEEGTAETVRNRVERGGDHGLSNGFAYPQRFRKSTAGCLMAWMSARTCGLASK
jgi:hypothetical protein